MRVLGIDLGKVRIGVAVGETESQVSSPRKAIEAIGTLAKDADQVSRLAKDEQIEKIVVGVPYNPDDSRMASVCERFAVCLRELGWEVELIDESSTSFESDTAMLEAGVKASVRAKRVDSESAVRILERFFHEKGTA